MKLVVGSSKWRPKFLLQRERERERERSAREKSNTKTSGGGSKWLWWWEWGKQQVKLDRRTDEQVDRFVCKGNGIHLLDEDKRANARTHANLCVSMRKIPISFSSFYALTQHNNTQVKPPRAKLKNRTFRVLYVRVL